MYIIFMSVSGPMYMYIDVDIFLITFKSTDLYSGSFALAYYQWRNTTFITLLLIAYRR